MLCCPAALHLAVMQARLNNVRVLLTESNVDAEAFNLRYASHLQPQEHLRLNYTLHFNATSGCIRRIGSRSHWDLLMQPGITIPKLGGPYCEHIYRSVHTTCVWSYLAE